MRILLAICAIIIFGCSKSTEPVPAGLQYYPDVDLLKKGLVFKYYYHQGKIGTPLKTDICYRKVTLSGDTLINEDYDAAFQRTYSFDILIDDQQWKTIEEKSYNYRYSYDVPVKEFEFSLIENVHTDWSNDSAYLEKKVVSDGRGSRIRQYQTTLVDSVSERGKCKVVKGEQVIFSIQDTSESEAVKRTTEKRFEEGLGLTQSVQYDDEFIYDLQLDEIMTLVEFERRADHGTYRVAYIDTLQTIDDHTQFQPCFLPEKINDYYNDRRAEFKGGKGRLRAILKKKLDSSKLAGQSGYLTFRFVVNCEGQAGWFVTEEAGLDYAKKRFSDDCRLHLYDILKAEKEWINLEIRKVPRDAYTYITFKINDGEIIEILP